MNTNGWVASSQRVYRWLLQLYPQGYRVNYELEMFHLFTDQCREVYKQRGRLGVLSLWLRTLVDVSKSVVHEHLSDPNSKMGLLEVVPNVPLPWKGVLLVLIPGLIFFVSQVEQVTSSRDWFFLIFYRAGYFLILPVLLVWVLTRRFPVWGLIPLGLLYETLWNYGHRLDPGNVPFIRHLFTSGAAIWFGIGIEPYTLKYMMAISVCLILLGILIWHNARLGLIPGQAWKWLGLYGLLVVLGIAGEIYSVLSQWNMEEMKQFIFQTPLWNLYEALPFLLLVFIGSFFAQKYGGLTFLLLLGYLLPTLVFGRYDPSQHTVPFYLVSVAVLVYRFVVALVAPVWLVRAASVPGRQRAAAIPVAVAIACHLSLNVIVSLAGARQYGYPITLLDLALAVCSQLVIAAGLGSAVALYLPKEAGQAVIPPPELVVATE